MLTVQNILNRIDANKLAPETPIEANVNGVISEIIDVDAAADDGRVLTFYVRLGHITN